MGDGLGSTSGLRLDHHLFGPGSDVCNAFFRTEQALDPTRQLAFNAEAVLRPRSSRARMRSGAQQNFFSLFLILVVVVACIAVAVLATLLAAIPVDIPIGILARVVPEQVAGQIGGKLQREWVPPTAVVDRQVERAQQVGLHGCRLG